MRNFTTRCRGCCSVDTNSLESGELARQPQIGNDETGFVTFVVVAMLQRRGRPLWSNTLGGAIGGLCILLLHALFHLPPPFVYLPDSVYSSASFGLCVCCSHDLSAYYYTIHAACPCLLSSIWFIVSARLPVKTLPPDKK
jgi:hypothetical protein